MKKLLFTLLTMLLPMIVNADPVEINGIYYNLITKGNVAEVTRNPDDSSPNKYVGEIIIPEYVSYEEIDYKVVGIANSAFAYSKQLNKVVIPSSISNIGNSAFRGCESLLSINIPSTITQIEEFTFEGCKQLEGLEIPNNVTSIGNYAFGGCESLKSIFIPKSVEQIGGSAFGGCASLASVHIQDIESWCKIGFEDSSSNPLFIAGHLYLDGQEITELDLPNTNYIGSYVFINCKNIKSVKLSDVVSQISQYAFSGCSGITSLKLPQALNSIGAYAFNGCMGLTEITIPSVQRISRCAFQDCRNLKILYIGNNVKTIYERAFALCPKMTDVYCYAGNVPSCYEDTFQDSYIEYATLHVPDASINRYKTISPWQDFGKIVGINGSIQNKCEKPTISYNNGKLIFHSTTEGASYTYEITDADIKTGYSAEVELTATYNISVFATKEGYENSDVEKATLCWIDADPKTEGITNVVANVRAKAVLIQSNNNVISISGADKGTPINVYNTSGKMVGSATVASEIVNIPTTLNPGEIALVKIGEKAVKIITK